MALSQTSKLDSLETALKNVASDSMRVRALKDIAWQHLNQRNDNVLAKKYIDSFIISVRLLNLIGVFISQTINIAY